MLSVLHSLFATFWAEFGARGQLGFTMRATPDCILELRAAFWAELSVAGQGRFAIGAGGSDGLAPILLTQVFVLFSHRSMRPDLFD